MIRGSVTVALTAACALSVGMTGTAFGASSTFEMRQKAVSLLGILTSSDMSAVVTREEFARMLVNASSYRTNVSTTSNVSVFSDVENTSEYAHDIRIAAENGWMSGYLGGLFRPEEPIAMKDAVKAVLALLGYENSDFSGNLQGNRMAKFGMLSLDSNIYRDSDEVLTREDCVNLFYNLMKAEMKTGGQYGSSVFGLTYNSDGEVNTSSILDDSLKGPKILNNESRNLKNLVPFSLDDATMFLNGETSDATEINDYATVIYYHESTKTIFAYSDSGENKGATEGRIKAIYYSASDPFTPTSVVLDTYEQDREDGENDEFILNSSELQYLFSVYGDFRVGDDIAIVWEKSGTDENAAYTAVDVVGDN